MRLHRHIRSGNGENPPIAERALIFMTDGFPGNPLICHEIGHAIGYADLYIRQVIATSSHNGFLGIDGLAFTASPATAVPKATIGVD